MLDEEGGIMPWKRIDVDDEFTEVKSPTDQMAEIRRNAAKDPNMPETYRAEVKIEDIHRTDLPGCPRHRTAGAIMQHSSHTDPDGRHNRYTGYLMCAECFAFIDWIPIQSIAAAESDDYYRH